MSQFTQLYGADSLRYREASAAAGKQVEETQKKNSRAHTSSKRGMAMRFTIAAGCGLSLLLACVGDATAKQRLMNCAERAQQIKTVQDQLVEAGNKAAAVEVSCKSETVDRRKAACSAYADALILKDERTHQLEALKADPRWRECPAAADATSPSVDPSPAVNGQDAPRNPRSSAMQALNTRTSDCGSRDCAPNSSKGTYYWRKAHVSGAARSRTNLTHIGRSGPTRRVTHAGRNDQHRRFR